MSRLVILALCVQACLSQSVTSQCGCGPSTYNYNVAGLSPAIGVAPVNFGSNVGASSINLGSSINTARAGSYGGQGTGQVAVTGDVYSTGNTVVVGSVPVLGAVEFSGVLPATGSVSISGQCGCGCN